MCLPLHALAHSRRRDADAGIHIYEMTAGFTSGDGIVENKHMLRVDLEEIQEYKLHPGRGFRDIAILSPPVHTSVGSSVIIAVHFVAPSSAPQVLVDALSMADGRTQLLEHLKGKIW